MRRVAAACCLAALGALVTAEARQPASAFDSLVEAERAFSRLGGRIGFVAAFLGYFADDVITFRPAPARGKEALRQAAASMPLPATTSVDWEPWYADISSAGDLGYTTGPTLFTEVATGKAPRPGWYFSVWKHDAYGWRVAADIGVGAPPVGALRPRTVAPGPAVSGTPAAPGSARDLLALERQVAEKAAAAGLKAAFEGRLAPSVRLYREGLAPLDGPREAAAYFAANPAGLGCQAVDAVVSQGGDLGFTYGTCRPSAPNAPAGAQTGFLHVWKRGGGPWLLAADVVAQ